MIYNNKKMFKQYSKYKYKLYGFTLLELLVVIAIVSVIANIAIAVVVDSRDKARLVGAQQFAKQAHDSFGATEILRWTFDSVTGLTVIDESGSRH